MSLKHYADRHTESEAHSEKLFAARDNDGNLLEHISTLQPLQIRDFLLAMKLAHDEIESLKARLDALEGGP